MKLPVSFKPTNVLKAVIVPYEDCKFRTPIIGSVFVIPVNPESYDESLRVVSDERVPSGKQHTDIRYLSTAPQALKLDFVLDGTNTIEGYFNPENLPVLTQIVRLKSGVYDMDGNTHRPRYIKVFWGSLVFCGVLSSMDVRYTLFNPAGIPIRAKVTLNITQHVDQELGEAESRKNSPDVTHIRNLKAGQRLDQMSNDIYNEANLMLQVAKANNLTSFRNVKAGTEITFPPIDKQNI